MDIGDQHVNNVQADLVKDNALDMANVTKVSLVRVNAFAVSTTIHRGCLHPMSKDTHQNPLG
jgi:hypothetical protein